MDFDMGKYGLFVWGSYGLSVLGLITLTLLSLRVRTEKLRALADLIEVMKTRQVSDESTDPVPAAPTVSKERSA